MRTGKLRNKTNFIISCSRYSVVGSTNKCEFAGNAHYYPILIIYVNNNNICKWEGKYTVNAILKRNI